MQGSTTFSGDHIEAKERGANPAPGGRLTGHAAGLPLQGCSGERAGAAVLSVRPRFYRVRSAARRATNATPQTCRLERKEKKVDISRVPTEGWGLGEGNGCTRHPLPPANGRPSPSAWLAGHMARDEQGPSPHPLAKQEEWLARCTISLSHTKILL